MNSLCERCFTCDNTAERILYEFAHTEQRTLDALRSISQFGAGDFYEQVRNRASNRLRLEREAISGNRHSLDELREELSLPFLDEILHGADPDALAEQYMADRARNDFETMAAVDDLTHGSIETEDLLWVVDNYSTSGLLETDGDHVRITPKGSRQLAKYVLNRVLTTAVSESPGTNASVGDGFGITESCTIRPYEFGDDFWRIDCEATLVSALTRKGPTGHTILFENSDLMVRETIYESRYASGLIIDESGSMSGEKLHTAIDVSLAMTELVGRNRNDSLNTFLFSNTVREVRPWEIANIRFSGGTTDIKAALKHVRNTMRTKKGSKQVYLVTDTEPNTEDGVFVGFDEASQGVVGEARRYRTEGITLNIVMLETTPHLKKLSLMLARENLGRVFFTTPGNMGKVIVEDYLRYRKGKRQ